MSKRVTLAKSNDNKNLLLEDNIIISQKDTMINLHLLVNPDSAFDKDKPKICIKNTRPRGVIVAFDVIRGEEKEKEELRLAIELKEYEVMLLPANCSTYKCATYTLGPNASIVTAFGFIKITGIFTLLLDENSGILTVKIDDNAWIGGNLLGEPVKRGKIKTLGFIFDLWYED
jgi:hypothetical protein